ncbi:MAG: hypothetical protein IPG53_04885 [Ignavibacteriales bacterium]|nr:hypothetical protein [Ignavibacteriales bacterium]
MDYIFISWVMTQQFRRGALTGPSPRQPGGDYNIYQYCECSVWWLSPEKLILGVALLWMRMGGKYKPAGFNSPSSYIGHPGFAPMAQSTVLYSYMAYLFADRYYTIPNNNKFSKVWFDDDSSTDLRISLAKQKNLRGVGMWALSYDEDRTGLLDPELIKYLAPFRLK